MRKNEVLAVVFGLACLVVVCFSLTRAYAQGGMSKATAKLLVTDLIEAGFAPTIREEGGVFFITVTTEPGNAATAGQVQTFASNRGVTARVLTVQFE